MKEEDTAQSALSSKHKWADEQTLVSALREGDEGAFGFLLDTYHGPLLRLAMAHVPSRAVAEEVVQETWQGVLESLPRFEGRSSLKTWMFRILTNRAKTRGQRERRYESLDSGDGQSDGDGEGWREPDRFIQAGSLAGHWSSLPSMWDEETPERLLLSKESRALIQQAISALPPVQRQVITLRDIDELDAKEVCNILEVTETNQRVLLHRARSRVRKIIEQQLEEKRPTG
ncbi:MAG: sigma-70 family RNA polymerase sigma factor [Nitrospirae bacterium]|nr:sigma-70 family RNA polymerase sigma factor [Nitrospirota bacterium]MDA1302975.1 sigma-70 family RNA polymerase sigma factor [Nitrospirota bacterium]